MRSKLILVVALATMTATPAVADAFCGFYVSGAGGDMFNNATQVVLMRKGTRTVLSMQNNYQGPPSDFALVIPVPQVLQEENVKVLPAQVFAHIDKLAAPRLVEYWEKDPCAIRRPGRRGKMRARKTMSKPKPAPSASSADLGVTIEAKFQVGEYKILILGAKDSTGLDTWLRREKYKIPAGAEAVLRPYVQSGMKFFVAKVDTKKVQFKDGMLTLSPLRFYYDSEEFTLPIRLGILNSKGTQDLIVHILGRNQRYEVANYKNVTIPTNLDVTDATRKRFGEFYAALFDRTLERNPGAVVTEYSWDSSSCDPCPSPPLTGSELMTFGMDVLDTPMSAAAAGGPAAAGGAAGSGQSPVGKPEREQAAATQRPSAGAPSVARPSRIRPMPRRRPGRRRWRPRGFTLTRLHVRYGKDIKDDLVFRAVRGIVGGRERRRGGSLEHGAKPSGINNFQARYAIRHEWTGPIECENPVRGRWGGPPRGGKTSAVPALDLAFAPRGKMKLASFVGQDVPELGVKAAKRAMPDAKATEATEATKATEAKATDKPKKSKGCGCSGSESPAGGALLLLFTAAFLRRRRRWHRTA